MRCPAEGRADKAAYAVAAKLLKADLAKQFPAKDMRVLSKYGAAENAASVRVQLTAGGVTSFEFRDKDGPLCPGNRPYSKVYAISAPTSDAISASIQAHDALRKAFDAKIDDYKSLIYSSTNLEQIEAVWPMASELRPRVGRLLPVTLSNDVIARIKADAPTMARAA